MQVRFGNLSSFEYFRRFLRMNPLLLDVPTEFSSERLMLRCYRPSDSAMYYQMLRTNWDHLYEFMPSDLVDVQNEQDVEVVIRRHMAEWDLLNLFIFGVWEKATGNYVGESYLANADWKVPCIEVGYFVVQASTGKGFASEAARATTRFAFEHLKVLRVELQVRADNEASIRVAERCGFTYEGRLRQRHRKKANTVVDVLWYGLLLTEWQNSLANKA
jgi:RimJ/RimL family protein N-acetyltransferase